MTCHDFLSEGTIGVNRNVGTKNGRDVRWRGGRYAQDSKWVGNDDVCGTENKERVQRCVKR